jgi:hypothetical protein
MFGKGQVLQGHSVRNFVYKAEQQSLVIQLKNDTWK